MDIEIGSHLELHCYKHNGKIHRTWNEIIVLDETDEYLVCGNSKVKITESDGRSHKTKEDGIMFFYKNNWFHVTAQLKNNGLFYKADIASPFLIDDGIIKYIDYDLDLKVFPDGECRLLDRNEYKYHKKIMKYSENLDDVIEYELGILKKMQSNNIGPFDKKIVDYYYEKYLNIAKK